MTSGASITGDGRVGFLAWAGLAALTVVRLVVAGVAPLSPDEAYYWVWSRALAPGFLDHPPMVAVWIWLGTAVAGDTALGVRLLGPLAAAGGSVLLWAAGRALFPGTGAGLRAAAMLNATLVLGAGAVTMTPDTPLLFFWTMAVWALARVAAGGGGAWWLVVGAAAGLGLDSKYTAALLGLGIGVWLLTPGMRGLLRTWWPWAGGVVAAGVFSPVVLWNAGHGWASFAKQGGRAGDWRPVRAAQYLGELVAGQAGLATPLLFVVFVAGVVVAVRRWRMPGWGLLAALVVPGALVFLEHAVGDRVQANWVAVLYPGAALAAGAAPLRWWRGAAWVGVAATALVYVQVCVPAPLPRGWDPTARLAGWDGLARAAVAARGEDDGFVASEEYGAASALAWANAGAGAGVPVLGAQERWRYLALPRASVGGTGLLLLSTRRREGPDPAYWEAAAALGTLERRRGGVAVEVFRLYRVVPRRDASLAILPKPERPGDAATLRP